LLEIISETLLNLDPEDLLTLTVCTLELISFKDEAENSLKLARKKSPFKWDLDDDDAEVETTTKAIKHSKPNPKDCTEKKSTSQINSNVQTATSLFEDVDKNFTKCFSKSVFWILIGNMRVPFWSMSTLIVFLVSLF
jgi:hypothetical protein